MIDLADLQEAVSQSGPEGDWLGALCDARGCTRRDGLLSSAQVSGFELIDPSRLKEIQPDFGIASFSSMLNSLTLIGCLEANDVIAVTSRPLSSATSAWLASLSTNLRQLYLADPVELRRAIAQLESSISAVAGAVPVAANDAPELAKSDELSLRAIQSEGSPAVKLVSSTIFDALRSQASDVHIESQPHGMVIKFRIDGVLSQITSVDSLELTRHAIARIKVLAELDIAEKRVPQDGRFRVVAHGRDIDIRVSIMPSIHGEDAVLRILDKKAIVDSMKGLTLDSLGCAPETIASLREMIAEPYGMFLVTGPTGSGKTTTLYAALTEINTGTDKIITIEDPVEYQLPGVLQIPVNEKKGLTFAVGLRSILRHDPDKIFVGEIRDSETAQIAVQSALTGHMVFTSVHANNAFDVIGRFIHMGVDPHNFVSSLTGVVAQRLVRQNCPSCRREVEVPDEMMASSRLGPTHGFRFMAGAGCNECRFTGFKGRRAVVEVLRLNDELRELITSRAGIRALKDRARELGMRSLREVALDLVREGDTSLVEVNRVTFVS